MTTPGGTDGFCPAPTALGRIALVERILECLDVTDPAIDVLWADEATDRLDAWRNGRLEAVLVSDP